jgi:hypothetical protein
LWAFKEIVTTFYYYKRQLFLTFYKTKRTHPKKQTKFA